LTTWPKKKTFSGNSMSSVLKYFFGTHPCKWNHKTCNYLY
jgi:hypothetical protein